MMILKPVVYKQVTTYNVSSIFRPCFVKPNLRENKQQQVGTDQNLRHHPPRWPHVGPFAWLGRSELYEWPTADSLAPSQTLVGPPK